jgi:hypothetical protein
MNRIGKLIPRLRQAPQPPLSHAEATPDSDRTRKPPLSEPSETDQEPNPGDRVEGLGNFGKPTGEFGTVERTNDDDALVKWDGDGRSSFGFWRITGIGRVGATLYLGAQSGSSEAQSKYSSTSCFLRESRKRPHMGRLWQIGQP